jgi:hypothetical protein
MLRVCTIALCQWLLLQPTFMAPAMAQAGLRIAVVQGEGAKNVSEQIAPKPLLVRVFDATGRPLEGAAVTFTAPERGPSGDFSNDSRTIRVPTASDGTANAGPYHPNATTGSYGIQVRAEFQGQTATVLISQTNLARAAGHKKTIAILALIAAAGGAAYAAHRGTSSSSGTPTITFGGSAVGSPK